MLLTSCNVRSMKSSPLLVFSGEGGIEVIGMSALQNRGRDRGAGRMSLGVPARGLFSLKASGPRGCFLRGPFLEECAS